MSDEKHEHNTDDHAADAEATPDTTAEASESPASFMEFVKRLGPAGPLAVLWGSMPAIAGFVLLARLGEASEYLTTHKEMGLVVYIGIFMVTAGLGLLPTYAQAVLGGWAFGMAVGIPAALAGFGGASIIGYYVTRFVSRNRVEGLIEENEKAAAVRTALVGRGFWPTLGIISLIRVPPNSPFALTNLVLASSGVKIVPYVLGTLIGMSPRTAVFVVTAALGAEQFDSIGAFMETGKGRWMLIGGFVTMVIVLAVIATISNKAIERVVKGGGEQAKRDATS